MTGFVGFPQRIDLIVDISLWKNFGGLKVRISFIIFVCEPDWLCIIVSTVCIIMLMKFCF